MLSPPPTGGNGPGVRQHVGGQCGGLSSHPGTPGPRDGALAPRQAAQRSWLHSEPTCPATARSLCGSVPSVFPGERGSASQATQNSVSDAGATFRHAEALPSTSSLCVRHLGRRPVCHSLHETGSVLPKCVSVSGHSWKSGCQRRGSRSQV